MSATRVKAPKTLSQDLQDILRTNRQYALSSTHDGVLRNTAPCLKWPYRTPPAEFIAREITLSPDSKFLKLPPILYVVSFQCNVAVKYLRHMVNVLGTDINAEYGIENEKAPGVPVGRMTPLGWFLYVTRWKHTEYYAHSPMLYELLRLGASPNIPVMSNFKTWQKNSPLYVALVNHTDPTMFFAKQLMDFGATFSAGFDYAPLVAAMRHNGCIDVIDLFVDNIAALCGTQNDGAFDNSGYTAMHYFIWSSLHPCIPTDDSLRAVKRYVEVLNKKLHVSMTNTNNLSQLPSDVVKNAAERATVDETEYMQDLLAYVLDLEKHEPRFMTVAAESVTKTLPADVTRHVQRFLSDDGRFTKRRTDDVDAAILKP